MSIVGYLCPLDRTGDERRQRAVLLAAGVDVITEDAFGPVSEREGWVVLVDRLDVGDMVIVENALVLGHRGRLDSVLGSIAGVLERGAGIRSIVEGIDAPPGSNAAAGLVALAQFVASRRTDAITEGQAEGRTEGRSPGRPAALDAEDVEAIRAARSQRPPVPVKTLAYDYGVHPSTISRMAVVVNEAPSAPRGADEVTRINVKGAIGYAWTLAGAETAHAIRDALRRAQTDRVVIECLRHTASPAPRLAELIARLRPGEVVAVPDLARLAPRLRGLLDTLAAIEDAGAALVSLGDGIDGRTTAGAEAIRAMLALRRYAPAAPRGSRSRGLSDEDETELLDAVRADPRLATATLAETFGVSPSTVRRLLKRVGHNRSPGRMPQVKGRDETAD